MSADLLESGIGHIFLPTGRSMPAYNFCKKLGFTEQTDTVAFAHRLKA